jgi:hypothetical protein
MGRVNKGAFTSVAGATSHPSLARLRGRTLGRSAAAAHLAAMATACAAPGSELGNWESLEEVPGGVRGKGKLIDGDWMR